MRRGRVPQMGSKRRNFSGGEREQSRQRRAAATAQGVRGLRALNPAQAEEPGTALPRTGRQVDRRHPPESAAPRCGKAEILPLQPHRVLGSAGVGGGGVWRVPPTSPQSRRSLLSRFLCTQYSLWCPHSALPSPAARLLKSHLLRRDLPDSIHLKLQTLPTPDASFFPHRLHSCPAPLSPPSHTLHLKHC